MSKHEYTVQVLVGVRVVAESAEHAVMAALDEVRQVLDNPDEDKHSHPWVTGLAFADPKVWGHSVLPGFLVFRNKEIKEEVTK